MYFTSFSWKQVALWVLLHTLRANGSLRTLPRMRGTGGEEWRRRKHEQTNEQTLLKETVIYGHNLEQRDMTATAPPEPLSLDAETF